MRHLLCFVAGVFLMLTVSCLNKSFGGNSVLEDVSFRVLPREKIGFIGPNGSGKTTLLRIIAGMEPFDSGGLLFEDCGTRVSLLSQLVTLKPYHRVSDEMRLASGEIASVQASLRAAEEEMASLADDPVRLDEAVAAYGLLRDRFDQLSGGDIEWEIDKILQGLGFSLGDKDRYVSEFSGGWQMRLEFAKLLLRKSDLLLLDEPTNHLDMQAVQWLEDYLASYPGALIIVSHDRYFLNRVTSKTLALSNRRVRVYSGNYDFFVRQSAAEAEQELKRYKEQQKRLEHDMRFIERFRYKATLATRVKSREKMVARRETVEAPERKGRSVRVNLEYEERQMTTVFKLRNLAKSFPSLTIEYCGEVDVDAGEKVALVGPNGCGKTTLLNILSGRDRSYSGRLKVHPAAVVKYYHQNQSETLVEENTAMEEMERVAPFGMTVTEIRTRLAAFLFFGDDVFKRVSVLSGGERARLSLAMMLCTPCNALLLDEPTNHLDIDSRDALASALLDFDGTVVVVSHDRYFIDQICTRVIEIDGRSLESYPGNYSWYFARKKQKEAQAASRNVAAAHDRPRPASSVPAKSAPSRDAGLKRRIERKEMEIEAAERRMRTIEELLADPGVSSDAARVSGLSTEYGELSKSLERLFEEYGELI